MEGLILLFGIVMVVLMLVCVAPYAIFVAITTNDPSFVGPAKVLWVFYPVALAVALWFWMAIRWDKSHPSVGDTWDENPWVVWGKRAGIAFLVGCALLLVLNIGKVAKVILILFFLLGILFGI